MITLTNGGTVICSQEDFERLSAYSWFHVVDGNQVYAARSAPGGGLIRMHIEVFGSSGPDHINGNGLDNRRENLRAATEAQNQMNRGKYAKATSNFKGVCWHSRDKVWTAKIKANGKRLHLGNFSDEIEAARAYNTAAKTYFGEYARLNNI